MTTDMQRLLEAAMRNESLKVRNFADLAKVIGESEQTLTNWKRRGIPSAKIIKLSQILGCDPVWLQFGDQAKPLNSIKPKTFVPKINHHAAEMDLNMERDPAEEQEILNEIASRVIPKGIREAILTLVRSSPKKKNTD